MYNKYGDSMNVNLLKNEENMSMYATKSSDGVRLKEFKEDIHIRISTIPTVNLSEKNMKEIPSENLS